MTKTPTTEDVRKLAHENVAAVDRQLDELAKSTMTDGETFEKAYDRALDTQMGRALMRTRDDAQAIATGHATEAELEAARKRLTVPL